MFALFSPCLTNFGAILCRKYTQALGQILFPVHHWLAKHENFIIIICTSFLFEEFQCKLCPLCSGHEPQEDVHLLVDDDDDDAGMADEAFAPTFSSPVDPVDIKTTNALGQWEMHTKVLFMLQRSLA